MRTVIDMKPPSRIAYVMALEVTTSILDILTTYSHNGDRYDGQWQHG